MRFAQKLTLTIVLLCVTLSVGGAWNIQQNMTHALNTALQQDSALHLQECYTLEVRITQEHESDSLQSRISQAARSYAQERKVATGQGSAAFAVLTKKTAPRCIRACLWMCPTWRSMKRWKTEAGRPGASKRPSIIIC